MDVGIGLCVRGLGSDCRCNGRLVLQRHTLAYYRAFLCEPKAIVPLSGKRLWRLTHHPR